MCVVGGRVKNWYFSLKDSEGGSISEIQIQKKKKKKKKKKKRRREYLRDSNTKKKKKKKKTEHLEIKQFGNNNNSVPKSKFEKGEVLRWSLRKKNPAAHTVPT